jgi:hypothetical protein
VDVAGVTDVDFTGGRMLLDGLQRRDVVVRHAEILKNCAASLPPSSSSRRRVDR